MSKRRIAWSGRQILLGIMALQILNLSVGSPVSWDDSIYDYSYSYNKTFDPTESAVEWIVEMNCGQQPRFSYSLHDNQNMGKSLSKSFHWKTDLQMSLPEPAFVRVSHETRVELPASRILFQPRVTFSPPPELASA